MILAPIASILVFLFVVNPLMKWVQQGREETNTPGVSGVDFTLWLCFIVLVIIVIAFI